MQEQAADRVIQQLQQRILQLQRDNGELAVEHARLRAILDNEPECVKLLAADGTLLEMNPAGLRMLEADSFEQVRNRCMYPLIVEEHRAAFRCLNETVLAGASGVLEFEIVGLKGGRRWLETNASPLRDAAGSVTAMLGLTRDITRRKAAEAQLAQQLSEMEQLYRTAPVGLALLDHKLRFVRINQRLAEINGRAMSDHIGRTLDEVVPALSGELRKLQQGVLDTGLPVLDLEISGVTPADPAAERHWLVNYLPVRDGDGVVVGVSAVVVDITERKHAETERADFLAAEQTAKKHVDWILDSVSDAFCALDKDWRYTYVNRRAGEILQRRPEDLIGKHIWTEFPQALGQPTHRACEKAMATQVAQTAEEYYPPLDVWIESRIYPHPHGISTLFQDITSRKRSERALRESEQRLQEAQRIGRIGDWTLDLASGRVDWSPQAFALYERDPAQGPPSYEEYLAGKDAENRDIVESNIARLITTGQQQSYDLQMTLPSGKRAHHAAVAVPIRDDSGRVTGVRGIVQDISERKQAEAALHARERLLSESQRIAHIGSWTWGLTGSISWSDETYRIYGVPPDTFTPNAESFLDLIHPQDRPAMQAWIAAGVAGEQPAELEFRVILSDGTVRFLSGRGELHRDAEGRPTQLAGTVQDISERKQVESALRQEKEILQLFVEHSPAVIFMLDRDMRYIVASRRMKIDFGLVEQDLAGRCHYDVLPDIPERWKDIHRRCLAGATETSDADHFLRADGRIDWIRWEVRPWHGPDGDIGGIIVFSEVITERVQAEQRLRDALLHQKSLAQRLAEVREMEQRHLSAELHDRIGQNLTALSINLNIISGSIGRTHVEAAVARLQDSRKLLETTIASVRDLVTDLRPPALDDYGLLAGLNWLGEQMRARTGLQISVLGEELSPRLDPRVESALFRIAQEALTNIVKHAQAQRVVLTLQREAQRVTLSIADDGCGFDPPTLPPSGLHAHWGLEVMSERAEAVGARLHVESTPGKGTRVVVDVEVAP